MKTMAASDTRNTYRRVLTIAWALTLVIGAFFLFAALSDLAADARVGLPTDHVGAFKALAGASWDTFHRASPGISPRSKWPTPCMSWCSASSF